MSDKIQKSGSGLVRKGTGLSALKDQVEGAKQAMVPPEESLVLVLDVSPSMGEPIEKNSLQGPMKIDSMREAAMTLITRSSPGKTQIGVVEFGDHARLHQKMTPDLRMAGESIRKIAGGQSNAMTYAANFSTGFIPGTNLTSGLAMSWDQILSEKETRVKRIVLMTDGEDNSLYGGGHGGPTLQDLEKYLDIFKVKGVIVDCIAFGASADRRLLDRIAGASGGVTKEAKNADELVKAFAQLEAGARGLLTSGS